jgi:hypothetical protein
VTPINGSDPARNRAPTEAELPVITYPTFACELVMLPPGAPHKLLLRIVTPIGVQQFPLTEDDAGTLGKGLLAPSLARFN